MSLNRFVYHSALIGGWAAFLAWLLSEAAFLHSGALGGIMEPVFSAALVGAAVGAGLNLVSGMTNAQWKRQLHRIVPGLIGGGIGGAVGGLLGALMYSGLGVPRAFGWMIMGLGIGTAEGIHEHSRSKIRNGLIGGGIGGFLGGLLFDPVASSGSDLSSRAMAFVILGLCVGALIGLAHVVLKEAWLTVVDGYRPGRQLILSQTVTALGRGDHLPLPLLGYAGRDLESEHLRITRQPDGKYVAEDNHSRLGTRVNGQPISHPVILSDGDLLRLGSNIVRFSHRGWGRSRGEEARDSQPGGVSGKLPTPPPPGEAPARAIPPMSGEPPPLPTQRTLPRQVPPSGSSPGIPPPPPPPS